MLDHEDPIMGLWRMRNEARAAACIAQVAVPSSPVSVRRGEGA